ncbi:MAG: DUF6261 family protein [Dysgonamonadaceae bacterium]|jgi:hypothetical protein|nr:DUF6261 family protein [Dysgonamonadaceae bacterium]
MAKFNALLFRSLPNGAHYRFFEKATGELNLAGGDVKSAIGPLATELNNWFVMETADMDWYRKNALTAAIADANHRLDNALAGFSAQVNAARHNVHPNVALAAERIHIMLKSYGRVAAKPYEEEIGDVNSILHHLTGDRAVDVQTIAATEWVQEITAAVAEFIALLAQRDAETLKKPQSGFPETRRGIENVWHQIVVKVNAGAELNPSSGFTAFINALNPEIDRLNGEFHHAKQDIAHAEPAPIPQQHYTGYPCTPATEVLIVTKDATVRLELGKDYNVTYKNNVEVGNAECTIHGKGAYRGHKTVTFIIAR